MKRFFCIFLFTILFGGVLSAQSYLAFPVGESWRFPDARTLGLAGAGSVSNSSAGALLLNPAAMAANEPGIHANANLRARSLEERRAFPVFDRFNDINSFGIYAVNDNWFANLQGSVQYNPDLASVPFLKSVAIGVFEETDLNYDYEEEVRENIFPDDPMAINRIKFDGRLMRYSFGAAFNVFQPLNVGFQLGMIRGDIMQERSVTFIDDDTNNQAVMSNRELSNSPLVASVGATYQLNPHTQLGGHVQLPYSAEYDVSFPVTTGNIVDAQPGSETVEYPMQATLGFEYRAQQIVQARLNVDVSYEWWSQTDQQLLYDNSDIANGLDDVLKIATGIEHIFFNQVPFRVGIQYRTSFLERTNARVMFAAGTGFHGKFWEVDLSAGFSRLDYRHSDLFADELFGGSRTGTAAIDNVSESYFFGIANVRFFKK